MKKEKYFELTEQQENEMCKAAQEYILKIANLFTDEKGVLQTHLVHGALIANAAYIIAFALDRNWSVSKNGMNFDDVEKTIDGFEKQFVEELENLNRDYADILTLFKNLRNQIDDTKQEQHKGIL